LPRAARTRGTRAVGVTVVTNAVNIANELTVRPNVKIVVTGGTARAQTYELVGPLAVLVINELQFDLAVIGVDGLDVNAGATADNEDEADINRLMASRARRVVVVADSTKFGRRAFAHICPLSAIDVLITDTGTSSVIAAEYAAQGIDVRRV
jgi:DeoR family transcriptional regulator of aga operon